MSAYGVSAINDADFFKKMDSVDERRKEMANYTKCIAGNILRFNALTKFVCIDGYGLDPESCVPTNRDVRRKIMDDFVKIVISNPKIDGKINNWSSGGFGSRWMDMDAKKYGLDYIRIAFYSKKFSEEWEHDKPFVLEMVCEKAR